MIIAITGGTGFIRRHLIARYVTRGDQMRYLTVTVFIKRLAARSRLPGIRIKYSSICGSF